MWDNLWIWRYNIKHKLLNSALRASYLETLASLVATSGPGFLKYLINDNFKMCYSTYVMTHLYHNINTAIPIAKFTIIGYYLKKLRSKTLRNPVFSNSIGISCEIKIECTLWDTKETPFQPVTNTWCLHKAQWHSDVLIHIEWTHVNRPWNVMS